MSITVNSENSLGVSFSNESVSIRIKKYVAYISIGAYINVRTLIDVTIESIAWSIKEVGYKT
jgi:hypothetical protein